MEIAFEESTPQIAKSDLAFLCAALNIQMRDHFAPAWLEEPWPVKAYPDVSRLPVGTFWPISILPTLDEVPDALGYHTWKAGLSYGRVRWNKNFDATCVTASHEALELRLDPLVNRWVKIASDKFVAMEACDPVQGDTYTIPVTIFGVTRNITVSDFVLPSYFVKSAKRPYSYLDNLDANAFDLGLSRNGGGYLITRDSRQNITNYFGRKPGLLGKLLNSKAPTPRASTANTSLSPATAPVPTLDPLSRATRRRAGVVGEVVSVGIPGEVL